MSAGRRMQVRDTQGGAGLAISVTVAVNAGHWAAQYTPTHCTKKREDSHFHDSNDWYFIINRFAYYYRMATLV